MLKKARWIVVLAVAGLVSVSAEEVEHSVWKESGGDPDNTFIGNGNRCELNVRDMAGKRGGKFHHCIPRIYKR